MPCTLKSFRLRCRRKLCESKRAVCTIKTKAAVKQNETPNRVWNKLLMIAECIFAWRIIYPQQTDSNTAEPLEREGEKRRRGWGCGRGEREKGWEGWMRWRKMSQPSEWDWDTCCRKKWGEKYVSERERHWHQTLLHYDCASILQAERSHAHIHALTLFQQRASKNVTH